MNFDVYKIKEASNLTDIEYISTLIHYFNALQEGRSKPDNNGGGYIKESVYNIEEIKEVKERINAFFNISIKENVDVKFVSKKY